MSGNKKDKKISKKKQKELDSAFEIIIADAFSLKSFLDFLKKFSFKIITLVLKEDDIYIKEALPDKKISVYIKFKIDTIAYMFDSECKELKIGINLDYMHKCVSPLKAKQSLVLFKKKGKSEIAIGNLTDCNLDSTPSGLDFFDSLKKASTYSLKLNKIDILPERNYNVYMSTIDLVTVCKKYTDKKIPINIVGYKEGVKFCLASIEDKDSEEDSEEQNGAKVVVRGFADSAEKIIKITIKQDTMKKLEKINSFNKQNNLVKLYFEEGKPVKLTTSLSYYAYINIYLYDCSDNEDD